MRGHVVRLAKLACLALVGATWCLMPSSVAGAGTIKGTVRHVGPPPEQRKVLVTIDQYVCGKEKEAEDLVLSPDRGLRNAVVSIQAPWSGVPKEAPTALVQIDQKQCTFVPRVVVVPAGGTVEFLNSDRLLHNTHGHSSQNQSSIEPSPRGA